MLCSISTSRSSPSWLDRLHASKGFTVSSDLDLDHFLQSNSNPKSTPSRDAMDALPCGKKLQSQKRIVFDKEQRLFDLMSNVLSELFVMGEPRDSAACLKGARKQLNPRACVPSASASVDGGASAMSPPSADNSIAEAKRDRKKIKRMRANPGHAAGSDPSVYTGTVVTVIDTSSPGWKSEKHFRKGMAWKGKEKKVLNVSRKKRKLGLVEKLIVEKERAERMRPLAELKGREQNENVESQNEACTGNINGERAKESDSHIQIPRSSSISLHCRPKPKFFRSPRLPVKKSSLLRLQVITKSHKQGTH
ncbi:uncharacterized protein LOC110102417 isoform X1 [Dendrobium catenatum]|uniref:uncharacterized protein LOC110102417 isoform X1 n=1 Tax=Dendrobium catenatum TaxID=906689 RepID=UPI0009F2E782|nr:uncharacterized protein LOC110102417 isoform X1 [Dendrobium catenatum]